MSKSKKRPSQKQTETRIGKMLEAAEAYRVRNQLVPRKRKLK